MSPPLRAEPPAAEPRSGSADNVQPMKVYYDGACPLCKREIKLYQSLAVESEAAIEWVDAANSSEEQLGGDLTRDEALSRFHVRLADGGLSSGAGAFGELWSELPGWRWLGRLTRRPSVLFVLEHAYRGFLRFRPALQWLARIFEPAAGTPYPLWLERELRSDHAGEAGAVQIYLGMLALSRSAEVSNFASRHLETESGHLAIMETLLPPHRRSRALTVWKVAGYLTGAFAALFGTRAVFSTVDAVETFVVEHYGAQITALEKDDRFADLRVQLEACCGDELNHRNEARMAGRHEGNRLHSVWAWLVGTGSRLAVALARRF